MIVGAVYIVKGRFLGLGRVSIELRSVRFSVGGMFVRGDGRGIFRDTS